MTSPILSPQSNLDMPDGLALSPNTDEDDSRTTSPEPMDSEGGRLNPLQLPAASSSWWGGSWGGDRGAAKIAPRAQDEEDLDVEDLLRRQIGRSIEQFLSPFPSPPVFLLVSFLPLCLTASRSLFPSVCRPPSASRLSVCLCLPPSACLSLVCLSAARWLTDGDELRPRRTEERALS